MESSWCVAAMLDIEGRGWVPVNTLMPGIAVFSVAIMAPSVTFIRVSRARAIPTLAFPGKGNRRARAVELLTKVGLDHRLDHRPAQLSGGERQRVAIARALINEPGLLLCDEPTGNLDVDTAAAVADLIIELHESEQNVLIVVTHSLELAGRFPRHTELREGRCVEPAGAPR